VTTFPQNIASDLGEADDDDVSGTRTSDVMENLRRDAGDAARRLAHRAAANGDLRSYRYFDAAARRHGNFGSISADELERRGFSDEELAAIQDADPDLQSVFLDEVADWASLSCVERCTTTPSTLRAAARRMLVRPRRAGTTARPQSQRARRRRRATRRLAVRSTAEPPPGTQEPATAATGLPSGLNRIGTTSHTAPCGGDQ